MGHLVDQYSFLFSICKKYSTKISYHKSSSSFPIFRTIRFALFYMLPLLIICHSYFYVYKRLRQHIKRKNRNSINPVIEREQKAQHLITALGILYALSWGPYHASKLYLNWSKFFDLKSQVAKPSHWIIMVSAFFQIMPQIGNCVDPIFYEC